MQARLYQSDCRVEFRPRTISTDPRATGGAQIKVAYGDGKGRFDGLAQLFRSIQFLETVAKRSEIDYVWPTPFTLEMQTCGHPGSVWDDETRTVTICYEFVSDFAELYRTYVQQRATTPSQKKKSR